MVSDQSETFKIGTTPKAMGGRLSMLQGYRTMGVVQGGRGAAASIRAVRNRDCNRDVPIQERLRREVPLKRTGTSKGGYRYQRTRLGRPSHPY